MSSHPSNATAEQRAANGAALQLRIASVMQRVADDPKQSRKVRAANTRDAKAARALAARMGTRS